MGATRIEDVLISLQQTVGVFLVETMVARGRFELPSMGLFLVRESKAHHWPGHCFRPLLVHYTTGLHETRVFGQDPISLLRIRLEEILRSLGRFGLRCIGELCGKLNAAT